MKNTQKGAVSGTTIAVLVVALIVIVLIGWMWKKGGVSVSKDTNATGTPFTYTIDNATTTASTTEVVKVTKTSTPTYKNTNTASAYTGVVNGTTYHNGTYGLTLSLPASWMGYRTYITNGGPNGLSGTAQIHFVAPGENDDAFVVNVWSKEQWNKIRTEENFVHRNTVDIGEGMYLGENFTWIYSTDSFSHNSEVQSALNTAVFY